MTLFDWLYFVWDTGHFIYEELLYYITRTPKWMNRYVEYKMDQLEEISDETCDSVLLFTARVRKLVRVTTRRMDSQYVRTLNKFVLTVKKFVFKGEGGFTVDDVWHVLWHSFHLVRQAIFIAFLRYGYRGEKSIEKFLEYDEVLGPAESDVEKKKVAEKVCKQSMEYGSEEEEADESDIKRKKVIEKVCKNLSNFSRTFKVLSGESDPENMKVAIRGYSLKS